jgi:hypothetical protein
MMRQIVIAAVGMAAFGCSPSSTETGNEVAVSATQVAAMPDHDRDAVIQKALAALKAEPKIKDVLYQPNTAVRWSVGVFDDGTSRNGYAEYLCMLLKENGVPSKGTVVRVVDIAKIAQGGVPSSETSLGSMNCESGQPFDA